MPNPIRRRRRAAPVVGSPAPGHAAGLTAANASYLQAPSSSIFVASHAIAIAGWVYVTNPASANKQRIISKEANAAGAGDEWQLRINPAVGGLVEWIYGYGISSERAISSAGILGPPLPANSWVFVYADLNPGSANTMVLSVNNQALTYNNFSGDVIHQSGNPITLGADAAADAATLYDGRIDALGVWNRQLTGTEVGTLYNSGSGLRHSTLPAGLLVNLVAWWDLDGPYADGKWHDAVGTNHLMPHGGVTAVIGKT